jgi:hypothetical protein
VVVMIFFIDLLNEGRLRVSPRVTAVSALNGLRGDFAAGYPVAFRGYADLVARDVVRAVRRP